MCDFINYSTYLSHTSHLCLRTLKRKYIWSNLHFIVDEKAKILHFHDEKNLGDLQFYIIV